MKLGQNPGRVIAIASGKGGVGKTWLSITLAHALAQRGEQVLLFDADLGLANVDIQLGLVAPSDLGTVLANNIPIKEACRPHAGGFDILAGRSGSGDLAALEASVQARVGSLLTNVSYLYDTVILDLGAGLDGFVREMAVRANTLLVVATDEPTSITDAYAVIKLHQRDRTSHPSVARIVINQATTRAAGMRTYATLAKASAAFLGTTPSLAGLIRRDEKVRDAIRRQTLLMTRHPLSEAGEDVCAMAAQL